MRMTTDFFRAAIAVATIAFAGHAAAVEHPRVTPGDCQALAAAHGAKNLWQTQFHGDKRDLWDNRTYYSAAPCFATLRACQAWLYWAQSDWPDHNDTTFCHRGGTG